MELDLSEYRWPLIALAAILLLAGLGWLGYAYTPAGDKPLTWSDWQVLKARSAYLDELGKLQAAADTLAALLNAQPDPVRAQLASESIQRLTSEGYLSEAAVEARAQNPDIDLYDQLLVEAVETYQREHLLKDDGIVGPATLTELNVSPAARRDQLRVNLERLRWLAREAEPTMVLVDIAGAKISYYQNGQRRWQARTQVGRAERQTPLLKSRISHLTLNPTWTVPPTIFREDKLPEIRRDIGYLAKNRIRVLDHAGNQLDPHQIDWSNPPGILLRQDAGPDSALGVVAIRFPNPFSVYLHDTPNQHLFDKLPRVFSSGCVRVEQVGGLLDFLLADARPAERERIASIQASGNTKDVNLPRPVTILMAYWTVEVGDDGRLHYRPDLYQRDAALLTALEQAERSQGVVP